MSHLLPSHPSIEYLKNEAKALVKDHRHGNQRVCETLRSLRQFAHLSDAKILASPVALHDAQYAPALSYGFDSWAQLKKHVDAMSNSTSESVNSIAANVYHFLAADTKGQMQSGRMEAADLEQFIFKSAQKEFFPVTVKSEPIGIAAEAVHFPSSGSKERARQVIHLVLLRLMQGGFREVHFDCTASNAMFHMGYGDTAMGPLPTGAYSKTIMAALRDMAQEPELGRSDVRVDRDLLLGGDLPGASARRACLRFQSSGEETGHILVTLSMPGSRGIIHATRKEIVKRIEKIAKKNGNIHVLTQTAEQAKEIAKLLIEQIGKDEISLLPREGQQIPVSRIVVSEVTNLCFTRLAAGIKAIESRKAIDEKLFKTTAICIDIQSLVALPCIVSKKMQGGDMEPITAEGVGPYLMLYGKVIELEEKIERK